MPVDHSIRIQENLIGDTTYIIGRLLVRVSIGHNPLSALLEVEQCLADSMGRGWRVRREQSCLDVDTLDFFFVLGFLNGFQQVVQSDVVAHLASHYRQRILCNAFVQRS